VVQKKHPLLNQLIKVGIGEEDQKSKKFVQKILNYCFEDLVNTLEGSER